MRVHELLREAAEFDGSLPGFRKRLSVLTGDDLMEVSGRYDTPEAFADWLVEPASPHAATAREEAIGYWKFWDQHGLRGRTPDPLGNASPLVRHIAAAIGATDYRRAREPGWGKEMIFTPDGYILTTPDGRVFLDAMVVPGKRAVWMSEISTENRSGGLGSRVMEAIRDYARQHGLGFVIFKVVNQKFFDRFDWLHPDASKFTYTMVE